MYTIYDMGIRIRERREELGMSRKKMSDLMRERGSKVNQKTIESWELGRNDCSLFNIPFICEVLDCDVEYLFGNSPTPHKEIASVMEITGLSEDAVNNLKDHYQKNKSKEYGIDFYCNLISFFVTSGQYEEIVKLHEYSAAHTMIKEIITNNGKHDEVDEIDRAMIYLFQNEINGIGAISRFDLYISASKHKAMDYYGDFFETILKGQGVQLVVKDKNGDELERVEL